MLQEGERQFHNRDVFSEKDLADFEIKNICKTHHKSEYILLWSLDLPPKSITLPLTGLDTEVWVLAPNANCALSYGLPVGTQFGEQ